MKGWALLSEGEIVLHFQHVQSSLHASPPALPFHSHQICMTL